VPQQAQAHGHLSLKSDALIGYECGQGARDEWVKHNGCMASKSRYERVARWFAETKQGTLHTLDEAIPELAISTRGFTKLQ
jgi:hypothetical protein